MLDIRQMAGVSSATKVSPNQVCRLCTESSKHVKQVAGSECACVPLCESTTKMVQLVG